jgi:uncharacterized repeat protein (TIGR01451 family)
MFMKLKRWSILLSTATLITVPILFSSSVLANFPQLGETVAQTLKSPKVKLILSVNKQVEEIDKQGKKKLVWQSLDSKAVVMPGDILLYTVKSENEGELAAKKMLITQPIPKQMVYQLNTAKSTASTTITYSIDGGKTFVAKPMVKKKLENGKVIDVPAPADLYTHIRWQFNGDLSAKKDAQASYQVKVK